MKHGGEQPGTEDRGSRAVTEDDADADTTGQHRAMRSVWLSMRDEDPPHRGMIDLLSAARAKAETMRASPTLRQRLAAWIRRPPALAFAMVVVLVGGAVLVLGRSSGHRSSDLAAGSSGAITERVPPEAAVRSAGVAASSAKEAPPDLAGSEPAAPTAPRRIARSPTVARGADGDAAPTKTAAVEQTAAGGHLLDEDTEKRDDQTPLERLYAQCSSAARRGDCAAVRTMVGKIAKTDRGYRARVAKDAAVARCLAHPVDAADALAE
ncbi:MAG TPA: hypothetical protein VLM79_20565 [Kofleriaceae bacterium]|nr:hypothetical protein [Kofleriaceae bacterium]